MSLYVEWLNLIKEKATSAWLTDGQRAAYEQVISRWQGTNFVNLVGPPGSGKTFLARILAKEHAYFYTHDLQSVPECTANIILDDASYTRLLRATAQVRRLGRVILVSRLPVSDPMPQAVIALGDADVRQFQHNLFKHCRIQFVHTIPSGTDLSALLRAELVARGGDHVDS